MLHKIGTKLKIAETSTNLTDLIVEDKPKQDHEIVEKQRSDFLYFRARAISAGDFGPEKGQPNPNGNGDYFPKAELEKAYSTFEGRNLFLNHESDHPVKSVGKVISSELIDDPETGEIYVECLSKIDKKLHPEIARKVETGELDTVSMGCSCKKSQCSICGHILETDEDAKCAHLEPAGLLKTFNAEISIPEYGITAGKPSKAFAINTGLDFNELSIVNVPADAQAFIKGIIASNIKNKITKQAVLDEVETRILKGMLNNLDEKTKKQVKAEFCGVCPPSQEEHIMSETPKSNGNQIPEQNSEIIKSRSEKDEMKEMLSGLDAYNYMKLADMFEKKFKKAEKAEQKTEKGEIKFSSDADTSMMKVQPKETSETNDSFFKSVIDKAKNSMAGKIFAQTIRRLVENEQGPKPQPSITAMFKKHEDLKSSTWTIRSSDKEKPIIVATLNDIWGTEFETEDQEAMVSDQYGADLVSFYKHEGLEKTSILLGVKAYEQMNVKDTKVTTPTKSEFKVEHNAKEDKAAEKSSEAMDKDEQEVGKHLEPEKKIQEAAQVKNEVKKEAKHKDDCDCNFCKATKKDSSEKKDEKKDEDKKEASTKEADIMDEITPDPESAPESTPEEAPAPDMGEQHAEEPEDKTLFDEIDKVTIGDGYEAYKDPETGEICIKDAQGQEVKRIPDAFGHDMPAAIDLLRNIMGLAPTEEGASEEAPAAPEVAEDPAAEESIPEPEDAGMYASKKDALTKEAEELKKQKEALDQEKRALEANKAELKASQFGTSISTRVEKCRNVVKAMFERDMLEIDEDVYQDSLDNGATVIAAREEARKHAASRQLENLLGLDNTSLEAFTKTLTRVQKKASKSTLKTAVHMPYPEDQGDEIDDIFGSMGSGGGRSKFDV